MGFFRKLQEKITPPRVDITLTLKNPVFQLGEELEGVVHLLPHENVECTEVRIELTCTESLKVRRRVYDQNLKREVEIERWESTTLLSEKPKLSGPLLLQAGEVLSFPFRVFLPLSLPPSFKAFDRRVEWSVKGVVAVSGRPDAVSKPVELQISHQKPSPEKRTVTCKYCGAVYPEDLANCPHCGAPRTA